MKYNGQFLWKGCIFCIILFSTVWLLKCIICIFCTYFKQYLNPIKWGKRAHGRKKSGNWRGKEPFCTEIPFHCAHGTFSPSSLELTGQRPRHCRGWEVNFQQWLWLSPWEILLYYKNCGVFSSLPVKGYDIYGTVKN